MRKQTVKLTAVIAVLLAVAALGTFMVAAHGEEEHDAGEPQVAAFDVLLSEFTFDVQGLEAQEGLVLEAGKTYKITFENAGVIEHEVMIGAETKTMEMDGQEMLHGYHHDLLSDMPVKILGEMNEKVFEITASGLSEIRLQPEQIMTIEFTLPDAKVGDYELGCFLSGHYQANMKIPVQVVAAE